MNKRLVLISGLPGSGKTTLARRLAPALNLRCIDKDDILESLFESKGAGDAAWRRVLSRESDAILEREATASKGAILVSFWRVPGMPQDSGTPVDWVTKLSGHVVEVHCMCAPEIAAERFHRRQRHPGHLDGKAPYSKVLASLRTLSEIEPLDIGQRVLVDTSQEPKLDDVVREVLAAFERHGLRRG